MELKRYQMFIDNEWVDASDGGVFESINPTTGEPWALIPQATADDVDRAIRAADCAFTRGPWSKMLAPERARLLRKLADLLADKSEALGATEAKDTGKLFAETRWQARYISEFFHHSAGLADWIHGETMSLDKPDMCAFTFREPLGVVAAIVPWNSQLFLVAVKIGPALAAGNTVVLKASEHASAAMLEFCDLIAAAGFPPGVINMVTGFGEPCGRVLTSHPLVARVSFTGGPQTARHIVRNSAENFAQVSLELGGKSPLIIFDDADLESAVNGAIAGNFGASGQSCVAGSRVYVHEDIADAFLARLLEQTKRITIGDPLDEKSNMGPLATRGQLNLIKEQVAKAQEQGAKLLHGGKVPEGLGNGWFYEPTILDCPAQSLEIVDTEMFGPVMSVLRFRDEDEVVELANDTKYGLAAGIFTKDVGRSMRVAKAIRAGIVWINTYRVVSPMVEFGGFKDSGYGRESGAQAIFDYTRPKAVWINTAREGMQSPFVMR